MRRVCFDIESNYYAPKTVGINAPWEARAGFEGKKFRFDAATAFDSSAKSYRDFTDPRKLFDLLLRADEIVTYNGRVCDLIVLEKIIGVDEMAHIWRKPHHDLIGWGFDWNVTLEEAAKKLLPRKFASWDASKSERLEKIRKAHPEFVAEKLAGAYRDARFTFALFRLYEKSRDRCHTYREDWKYLPEGPPIAP